MHYSIIDWALRIYLTIHIYLKQIRHCELSVHNSSIRALLTSLKSLNYL